MSNIFQTLLLNPSELSQQSALFLWTSQPITRQTYPGIELMFAIPNGGQRSIQTASLLKASGVKSGVPDILLPVPRQVVRMQISPSEPETWFHGLFIEMKSMKNKNKPKPSPEQLTYIDALQDQGYKCVIAYGFEEAKQAIEDYYKI